MDPANTLINIVVSTIIVAPFLWISGRSLVGKDKAKFFDAIWIVLLGSVINVVIGALGFAGILSVVLIFIVWLGLIKHFFDCGWIMAFAIALIAVIMMVIVTVILGIILGLAIIASWI